ncbi:MAG TPA: LUD domain-containing protein [Corynebacterium sp.]|uniref:LutC/YkgG family protein n=1 Tax=Corynebacterium sp. TaxID=1720 RepID=UPI0018032BBD|nr:LUD domain-containing protein [Corynebacterium sp.]HHT32762.1 LUD domain-containing protein [Corynebacterium sp.]
MSDAKNEILGRIRAALDDAPVAPEVPRGYRRTSALGENAILDMLEDRLVDYRATVFRETAESLPGRVRDLLADADRVVVPPGLDPAWLPDETGATGADADPGAGTGSGGRFRIDAADAPLGVRELNDAIDAVVTSSTVSCAETGTIFLSGRDDEGRRAISLVPDHHICVIPVESVVELFPEALARVEPTAPITMISGPSATSDIELERVEGVHGPRRLDVVLLG